MESHSFVVFLIAAITLNVTPGPDVMYVMSRSLTQGRRAGVLSSVGLGLGYLLHTLAAAFGLSALLMSSAIAFQVIKYAGAAYLIFLGLQTLLAKQAIAPPVAQPSISSSKLIQQGLLTSILNPKVGLFFLAFLPQFVRITAGSAMAPFVFLGVVFTLTATTWNTVVGFFAGYLGEQFRRRRYLLQLQQWLTGVVLIGLGMRLAVAKQK